MSTIQIADAAERLQALDIESSYCVQAPAGSGKTELLTQRILKLLAHCEQPEEVLAFTFTRKAAAEMRNRLLQSLNNASRYTQAEIDALPEHGRMTFHLAREVLKQNQEKNWHLLENTQRLRITTIDAFNAYITNLLPIVSAFGSQPEISNDMEPVFQQAVQDTLKELDTNKPHADQIGALLQHLNNNLNNVQTLLMQLLRNRDQWLSYILIIQNDPQLLREELNKNLSELVEENLEYAEKLLQPYTGDITQLLRFAAENLALEGNTTLQDYGFTQSLPESSVSNRHQWQALAGFFLTAGGDLRKTVDKRNGFPKPADGKDAFEKESFQTHKDLFKTLRSRFSEDSEITLLFKRLQVLPAGQYQDSQWEIISALTAILPALVAHLSVALKQQGKVDYVQVSSAALEALGDEDNPTDLAMRLDYRIKHILVDEFQDTSSLQSSLIEKLTWGWEPDDGRTLFIVGDGMQSCYGFRNANVGLFLAARDNGIGSIHLNSLQLKVNFRSEAPVVNWVNQVFSDAFPALDDISRGAVSYNSSEAIHNQFEGAGVEALISVSNKEDDLDKRLPRLVEAEALVQQCQNLLQNFPESSIAILVRNRSHLQEVVPALRLAGIPWNASGIDSLTSYTEISDLLSLLKALLNLADKTALLALLRAPFIGLSLADIHQLSHRAKLEGISLWQSLCDYDSVQALSEDGLARLQKIMPHLISARNNRQQKPLRDWLESVWILLGGPASLKPETDLDYINTFFQTLEEESEGRDIIDMHRFEEKTAAIYVTGKHKPEVKLQIMTIHNAKGLEFDFVLVPGLERSPRANDKSLLLYKEHLNHDGEEKLLLSLLGKKGEDDDPTYQYLRYEEDIRAKMENTRLLYIAVTRAAKKAFLYANVTKNKDKISSPASASLLFSIWSQLEQQDLARFNELTPNNRFNNKQENSEMKILTQRFSEDWENPIQPIGLDSSEENTQRDVDESHLNLLERKVGDIIHYCLKLKVEKNLELLDEQTLQRLSWNWAQQLKLVCENSEQIETALKRIKDNLQNCLNHPLAQWVFDHSQQGSACELALSDYRFEYRQEYIIDRTFVDKDNVRWIIDYKSSQQKDGQSIEEFELEQTQSYQSQLDKYAQLFKTMEARPVKAALFFTAIPHWLEISI